MPKIQMVDLQGQHEHIRKELNTRIGEVIDHANFIGGSEVKRFEDKLAHFLGVKHVISCGNGTDALQIALMSLELPSGSEVICPSFNYVAAVEVIALLGYTPKFVEVNKQTFCIDEKKVESLITENTSAIIPVHLFGQAANMGVINALAKKYRLKVVEDTAQSLGCKLEEKIFAGTIGEIGITSFFPSKNLGCLGDGGAIFTNDDHLADRCRMIARHGQRKRYEFEVVGINSRLDAIQAAILDVKLEHLKEYNHKRRKAATQYDKLLGDVNGVTIPARADYCNHVFNQYTIQTNRRDELRTYLANKNIPTAIYYPKPLHLQAAYHFLDYHKGALPVSEKLCNEVLSLPMHTELTQEQIEYICREIKGFFRS